MSSEFGWWYNWLLALQHVESSILPDVIAFGSPRCSHMSECFSDSVFLGVYSRCLRRWCCGTFCNGCAVMSHVFDKSDILSASLDTSLDYGLYVVG